MSFETNAEAVNDAWNLEYYGGNLYKFLRKASELYIPVKFSDHAKFEIIRKFINFDYYVFRRLFLRKADVLKNFGEIALSMLISKYRLPKILH